MPTGDKQGVSSLEVQELLRKVGTGELAPRLVYPEMTWDRVFVGNVYYVVDGWEVVIFNDCGSWDYIDSVKTPDGRIGKYEDWLGDGINWEQPDDMLYIDNEDIAGAMEIAFIFCKG